MTSCLIQPHSQAIREEDRGASYNIQNSSGEVVITCHHVFPGIDLVYHDAHIEEIDTTLSQKDTALLEISHCREGRVEQEIDEGFYYLAPGDTTIRCRSETQCQSVYPLCHYHGLSILIDCERAPHCLSCFLEDVNVSPKKLLERFCTDRTSYILRSDPAMEVLFSELYTVKSTIRKGFFKVKILEILLQLSQLELPQEKAPPYAKQQVKLAKNVRAYLTEHMDQKITIDQLAKRFHVSLTTLKNSFKGVYGESVYAYIREQKMHAAAIALKNEDATILEIAGRYGYENGSKFAKAFQTVIGMTPSQYRKTC